MTLTIPEGLILLSLKNETGQKAGEFVEYGLAGGAIAELLLMGRLAHDEAKPKNLVIVDASETGDAFLDFCLDVLGQVGNGKPIKTYVNKLANKSRLFREQASALAEKGVLTTDPQSFLFFNWTHYPEADPSVEVRLVEHLRAVMFEGKPPEARDCVAIALADKTGLLRRNFDKAELKTHKKRIKEIAEGGMEPSKATVDAIAAVQAALIVTTVAAATVASSS